MSQSKKSEKEADPLSEFSEDEFRNVFDAMFNNFQSALSLHDAGDDAMSTPEIMEVIHEVNPFIPVTKVVKAMQEKGFNFQFDLKERQFKWLIKYGQASFFDE